MNDKNPFDYFDKKMFAFQRDGFSDVTSSNKDHTSSIIE